MPGRSRSSSKRGSSIAPDLALSGDNVTILPSSVTERGGEHELMEPFVRFRSRPIAAMQETAQYVQGTGWRSYDDIVGTPIFYPGFSENMTKMVMAQPKLKKRIAYLAGKRVEVELEEGRLGPIRLEGEGEGWRGKRGKRRREIETQLEVVAEGWVGNMICKMESKYFIRGAYYFATQLLTRAYHQGIHVNSQEVLELRKVAQKAARKRQSIVFLPCHRSHVDYVSLQLICYRLGIALPTVVAGDNLNVPLLGSFLQHAGAMWIRRSFGEDQLYSTLVQSYVDTLLQNGHNFECFIEGGRSRTGKLLPPKFGILSYVLDSVLSGSVEDCLIVPVSTQYDKVVEVDSYISELLGKPKKSESLSQFLSASNVLSLKLGRVDMRFHEAWSLRGFITEQRSRLIQQPSPPSDMAIRRRLLTTLGFRVLKEINDVSVVMPTALVGTVLLTLRGRGVGKSELVRRVRWLGERVRAQNGRIAHVDAQSTESVVDRALEVLGPNLVGRAGSPGEVLAEETFYAEDRFQLSFYRNMTIHLFISQALICAALYTRLKESSAETQAMSYADLRDYLQFLSQLFRAEFIFDTRPLDENLADTLKGLAEDDILSVTKTDDGSYDTISLHQTEAASGRENFDFYCFLIWPFIEAVWLGAVSLFMLVPPHATQNASGASMKTVQALAQLLGKTLYAQGDLSYFESVNKEALSNAYTRQEEEKMVVVTKSKDAKVPAMVRLSEEWMPKQSGEGGVLLEGRLWDFCERISKGRREGEHLRDPATVRTRVQGLVGLVRAELWSDVGDVDKKSDNKLRAQL